LIYSIYLTKAGLPQYPSKKSMKPNLTL